MRALAYRVRMQRRQHDRHRPVINAWRVQIWTMVDSETAKVELDGVQRWVTDIMTWAYMLTQQIWVIFLAALYFSRLGGLKMGKPTDEPEYPTASWFMMMFSAGIGIGLFFFGVAEPVWCALLLSALHELACLLKWKELRFSAGAVCVLLRFWRLPACPQRLLRGMQVQRSHMLHRTQQTSVSSC